MALPSFTVTGNLFEITGEIFAASLLESAPTTLRFTFTPNLSDLNTPVIYGGNLYKVGIVYGGVESDGTIVHASIIGGRVVTDGDPIQLVAEDAGLNVTGLMWKVSLETPISGGTGWQRLVSWWIDAYADGATVDLSAVPPAIEANANPTFITLDADLASPYGVSLVQAVDAEAARDVLDVYSTEQVVGTADDLPNESGFWWVSEPVAVDGRVYMSTCADDRGTYLQEWTQPVDGGPYWLHRYFLGFSDITPPLVDYGRDDLRDDHCPAGIAVAAGKPLVAFWSGHGSNSRLLYRISDQNIDDVEPGQLTFGATQTYEVDADERTTYAEVMHDGTDIWVVHRSGYNFNEWSVTKFPDWATGTPERSVVFSSDSQCYVKARMVGSSIRCIFSDHPSLGTLNTVSYAEINTSTGSITQADGTTVLGNLDGTNLPLEQADLETVFTSSGSNTPWVFDVGYSDREALIVDGDASSFATTGKYKYARYSGGSWTVTDIADVGLFLSSSIGAYFPSVAFVPDTSDVLLARSSGGVHYIETYATADSGATWTLADTVDSSAADWSTKSPRGALTRAYPVRTESGTAPFDVIGTDIREYPNYYYGWTMHVRPLPLSHPVKRVPEINAVAAGLAAEVDRDPAVGLHLPGTSGNYVSGPTGVTPTDGIRIEVDAALPDWSAGYYTLVGKEKDASNREPRLMLTDTGKVGFYWSADGPTASSVIPNDVPPVADWQRMQLAVDFIPSVPHPTTPGSYQKVMRSWYRFSDAEAWRPLAADQSSPASSIFTSNSPWEIGSRRLGTTELVAGIFYRASVMTVGGTVLAEWRADRGTVQTDRQGNTWTLANRAVALTAPVLSIPKIDYLMTTAGKTVVQLQSSGTPNNYMNIASSDTNPYISVGGASTDVSLNLVPKGAGRILANSNPVGVKVAVPATASSTGALGQWAADTSYIYVCVGADTWMRAPIATW